MYANQTPSLLYYICGACQCVFICRHHLTHSSLSPYIHIFTTSHYRFSDHYYYHYYSHCQQYYHNNLLIIKLNRINCVQIVVSIENRNIIQFLCLIVCVYGFVSNHIYMCYVCARYLFAFLMVEFLCCFFNILNLLSISDFIRLVNDKNNNSHM